MLVLGATSGIAQATIRLLAEQGWDFILAGRDMTALHGVAAGLASSRTATGATGAIGKAGAVGESVSRGPVRGFALFDAERPETHAA